MEIFLIDDDSEYEYKRLLKDIREQKCSYKGDPAKNLYEFYLNLICTLINGGDIIFEDDKVIFSDNSDKLKINLQNNIIDDIIDAIRRSESNITLFTSGTTGQPKKIIHSINNLIRTGKVGSNYTENIWGLSYNPTHIAGLLVFFQAFFNKCTMINLFNKRPNQIYSLIEKYKITNLSATPTFYRMLMPFEKSYNSVTRITFGGEKSGEELHETIKIIFPGARINNIYASTEAGQLFSSKGEIFKIPPEIRDFVRVIDDEILVHRSLLGNSDEFSFDSESFYRTGDLIEWVNKEDGLFKFKSRKNELINVGGYKVNPADVENAILKMPEIKNTVVFGIKNSVLGNIVCCDVELNKGKKVDEFTIRNYLSGVLLDYEIPRRIKFVDNIELTKTGKVRRK